MWDSAIEAVVANGAWEVLFCPVLIFELKDSRRRERKYQETIASLGDSLTCVKQVAKDVEEIKYDVRCGLGMQEYGQTDDSQDAEQTAASA